MAYQCDFLVIGTGLAGLTYALEVAAQGKVWLICKTQSSETNTSMAQGGIAAVMAKEDSFAAHIEDTLRAGAGLCRESVVREFVEQGPHCIAKLREWGVVFDGQPQSSAQASRDGEVDLTREGGHSARRILHIADHTGRDIHLHLWQKVVQHPNVTILEQHYAIDLILDRKIDPFVRLGSGRCLGAYVYDRQADQVRTITARWTVLATGGAGKVYLYTSNWAGATGDGIAMAYRAGARVANLEFMQFHPTCLYHPQSRNFLISEALRGEGGELINKSGVAFMQKYHPMGSLAPRDIVARSIDAEMKKSGEECVFLDMTRLEPEFVRQRFPVIYQNCLTLDIDITRQPIPVVPAAHYLCGGVIASPAGETDLERLLVIGESACTGFHGANRLASNSLLECVAMGINAAHASRRAEEDDSGPLIEPPEWVYHNTSDADELIVVTHMWEEIRRLMWDYVGIVRSDRRLERARHRLTNLRREIREYYWNFKVNTDLLELRNIALLADLTVRCALRRKESRGIHYNIDYPTLSEEAPRPSVESPPTLF